MPHGARAEGERRARAQRCGAERNAWGWVLRRRATRGCNAQLSRPGWRGRPLQAGDCRTGGRAPAARCRAQHLHRAAASAATCTHRRCQQPSCHRRPTRSPSLDPSPADPSTLHTCSASRRPPGPACPPSRRCRGRALRPRLTAAAAPQPLCAPPAASRAPLRPPCAAAGSCAAPPQDAPRRSLAAARRRASQLAPARGGARPRATSGVSCGRAGLGRWHRMHPALCWQCAGAAGWLQPGLHAL